MRVQNRRDKPRSAALYALLALALLLSQAGASWAQNPHEALGSGSSVPDVPAGTASISGLIVHPDGNEKTAGSTIVLYSLAADGNPGFRTSATDASGAFRFGDLSNAPGITYLVGASYRGVPHGRRIVFEPGQSEIHLEIEVDDPISDVSKISVGESSLRLEWVGANLGIEEVHQLENSGDEVVFVAPEERAGKPPPFRVTLPEGAEAIDTSVSGNVEGFEVRGRELLFWGPAYAGGHELRFRYLIPIASAVEGMSLRWQLDSGSRRAKLLYPAAGPTLSLAGVSPAAELTMIEDRPFRSLDAGEIAPGASIDVAVALPALRNDRSAITLPRADYWLDADDIFMQVNVDLGLEVAAGAHLAGTVETPLLVFDLPPGAEFRGFSPETRSMGLLPTPAGDLALIGPLAPGTANLAFRYRLPVHDRKPQIDIRLPGAVDLLNVLIADNGVVIQTDRLHRRRPFRQSTRVYLHREAFAIDEGEVVSISMDLIDRGAFGRNTHLFATSALAALGVWFITSPLVRGRRTRAGQLEAARIRSERDLVYQAIRDLEHDFETTKIEQSEYHTMRADLRTRALELLQEERDAKLPRSKRARPQSGAGPEPDDRCSGCGKALSAGWQFCPKCGAASQAPTGATGNGAKNGAKNLAKEEP